MELKDNVGTYLHDLTGIVLRRVETPCVKSFLALRTSYATEIMLFKG